jgi:hypothetical protein
MLIVIYLKYAVSANKTYRLNERPDIHCHCPKCAEFRDIVKLSIATRKLEVNKKNYTGVK